MVDVLQIRHIEIAITLSRIVRLRSNLVNGCVMGVCGSHAMIKIHLP